MEYIILNLVCVTSSMATISKQYKNIGEDLWKGRSEKIVGGFEHYVHIKLTCAECRTIRTHIRRSCRATHPRLRRLRRSQQTARKDGLQHRYQAD
jgi:hypothetical protein